MSGGGWFGTVPDRWTSASLGYYFDVSLGKMLNANKDTGAGHQAPYLAAGSIQPDALALDDSKTMPFTDDELNQYDLRRHDIVVVEGGAGYGRSHLLKDGLPGWGFQNHVARLRSRGGADPRFVVYCLKACLASGYVEANNRTATLPSLSRDVLRSLPVPLPPPDEQGDIAAHLDRETARIDELITEQERLVDLLQERREAVVDSVVTSGLNAAADTRDSGCDWIGAIPGHWRVRPLWSMFRRTKDVDHPDEQMLSVFRDFGVVAKDSRANNNQTAENRSIYQLVHPGWLVTNRMKAWQGSVGVSALRGIVSGHYICFAPTHDEDSAYLNWLFRSRRYAVGYATISRGVRIGQAEIDNDDYRVLPVVLPPVDEQRAIAVYLEDQTSKIDVLIEEAERLIELARERRSALITAAVTGQIDVGSGT